MRDDRHWVIFGNSGMIPFGTYELAVRRATSEVAEGDNNIVVYKAVAVVRRDPPIERPIVVVPIPEEP